MRLLALVAWSAVLLGVVTQAFAQATKSVAISVPTGVEWKDELIHCRLDDIPVGTVKGEASASAEAKGMPPLTTQVSDVTRHSDGSIKGMTVWLQVSVPSGGTVFNVSAGGKSAAAKSSVTVKQDAATIELSTAAPKPIAIRFPAGARQWSFPATITDAPGPIHGLTLPNGSKVGPGRWEVPFRILSYSSELTANGPLFAEVKTHYAFDSGYWTFTARMIRGCPMVVIHEELDTGHSNKEWDKTDRFYSLVIGSQQPNSALRSPFMPTQVFFNGRNDRPEQGTIKQVAIPPAATQKFEVNAGWFSGMVSGYTPTFNTDRDDFYVTGYPSVLPRVGSFARWLVPGGDALGVAGLQTDYWRNPMSLRGRSNKQGEILLSLPLQMYKQGWSSDGFGVTSQNYTGKTVGVAATTARRAWGLMLSPAEDETTELLASLITEGRRLGAYPLDKVKDWKLEWPDPKAKEKWADKTSENGAKALTLLRRRVGFAQQYGGYGRFSMAYHYGFTEYEYSVIKSIINSAADLTAADRQELRALAAWNAYDMNQVDTFPWGTGFHLNNPNMSIMATKARAQSAALIPDHPMFKEWGAVTVALLRETLKRFSRDSGATYENPHYTLGVTFKMAMEANKLLMENGIGDACDTEAFKNNVRFFLHWVTPPDPRFLNRRMAIPIGNSSYQSVPRPMAELLIEYFKTKDPQLAGQVQWWANQTQTEKEQIKLVADVVPALSSKRFEDYGVYFRHGFGTPYETMMHLYAGNCDGHAEWEADQVTYTLYAKGQPINLHFGNGYFPMFCRPWTRNRVSIDHKFEISERNDTNVASASFNPQTEYARAYRTVDQIRALNTEYTLESATHQWAPEESKSWPGVPTNIEQIPPVTWYRQIMFLKDADPKGPNYFVIRDGFGGTPTRPTDVSYWFLANKIDRNGNTFHADGQCLVNMDMFVNTPATFEPETGQLSHAQQPYGRDASLFDPKFHPDGKLGETQRFVRLKQPAGKGYMVVLYPRLKENDLAATFTRLADSVVRVETPLSSDYALVDPYPFEFKDDKVEFKGMAASVRFFKSGKIVIANSEGEATIKVAGKTIAGTGGFMVTIEGGQAKTSTHGPDAKVEVK